jgi:hypothetical protein
MHGGDLVVKAEGARGSYLREMAMPTTHCPTLTT